LADKVPIEKIKIDTRLFSYPNSINVESAKSIAKYFDLDLWNPILVNKDYFLLDGQHRLEAAKSMGLKYIDVIVQHVENYSYYYGKAVKGILSTSRKLKGYPKIGVRAYARTPIFGLLLVIS
jgi:hypothetical protein